jgi:hypothetical protein
MSTPVLILLREYRGISIFHSYRLTMNPIVDVEPGFADSLSDLLEGTFQGCLPPELFDPIRRHLDLSGRCIVDAAHMQFE